ncbi:MAG TPA: hypothetical protein VMB18_16065 [Terriglobales bacterium]|nr:hypothetical protein [Terriglobales bacterium]
MASLIPRTAALFRVGGSHVLETVNITFAVYNKTTGTVIMAPKSIHTLYSPLGGDYSSMAIDRSDDCTFWYSQEYYKTTGNFAFNTDMNSFNFTTCQ